jgi:ADP-ribose pyrophosphatase YjhB (NUDIX family)
MAARVKEARTSSGSLMHFSVGAIIERDGKYLLIERAQPPFGFACVAGHLNEDEDPYMAVVREVHEEVGLVVRSPQLILTEVIDWNWCRRGVTTHHWHLFNCPAVGRVDPSAAEVRSADWYTKEQIAALDLEDAWNYWFGKLGIL